MRFGYWMPVFGGWLRNVPDEGMRADWTYVRDLAVAGERAGFDLSLLAELNLNDIKGHRAPALDAWTLAPAVAARLVNRLSSPAPTLTARELDVLDAVAGGATNKEIAKHLFVSEATVKTHLVHINEKLGATSRTEAVALARRAGLLR